MEDKNTLIRQALDELRELKKDMREKQAAADDAKKRYQEREHHIFNEMFAAGLMGHKTTEASYAAKSTIYANVQDIEAFETWCRENHLEEEFIKAAPEKARLNELVRERLDNGEELPPGIHYYAKNYISITETKNG